MLDATAAAVPQEGVPIFPRTGRIHVYDTHVAVWEENTEVPAEVWERLLGHLEGRGWTLTPDPTVHPIHRPKGLTREKRAWYDAFDARWASLHRVGRKGDLELCGQATGGRTLRIDFFQNVLHPPRPNPNGGRYEFHKMLGMPSNLRLLCAVEMVQTIRFLMTLGYAPSPELREPFALSVLRIGEDQVPPRSPEEARREAEGHGTSAYDRTDKDGALLVAGDVRYFYESRRPHARLVRARFYPHCGVWRAYPENGGHLMAALNARELFSLGASLPPRQRRTDPERHLRRLQVELKRAELAGHLRRVEALKAVILRHGGDPGEGLYYVLSLDHSKASDRVLTWWGPDNSGYAFRLETAGKYTRTDVTRLAHYYDNGTHTAAIPCGVVDHVSATIRASATENVFDPGIDLSHHIVPFGRLRSLVSSRKGRTA